MIGKSGQTLEVSSLDPRGRERWGRGVGEHSPAWKEQT